MFQHFWKKNPIKRLILGNCEEQLTSTDSRPTGHQQFTDRSPTGHRQVTDKRQKKKFKSKNTRMKPLLKPTKLTKFQGLDEQVSQRIGSTKC